MQRCRPRARCRAGAPPTWATKTLGFLSSRASNVGNPNRRRIENGVEHEISQKSSQPAWRQAHLARSRESQPPVCVARRAIGRGQCECPVPSPRVFLHRFPLCSTRGTSAKKKRRTSQAAEGRTDADGGVRFTWTVMCLRRYRVQFSSPLPSLLGSSAERRSIVQVCAPPPRMSSVLHEERTRGPHRTAGSCGVRCGS